MRRMLPGGSGGDLPWASEGGWDVAAWLDTHPLHGEVDRGARRAAPNGHRRVGPAWGTNLGEFYTRRQPAKRSVIAVFSFEGDRTTNERVYFEAASLLPQVGPRTTGHGQ